MKVLKGLELDRFNQLEKLRQAVNEYFITTTDTDTTVAIKVINDIMLEIQILEDRIYETQRSYSG